jgi:multiple sugar transport system permease protein
MLGAATSTSRNVGGGRQAPAIPRRGISIRFRQKRHGSDFVWAVAFTLPYAGVFIVFAIFPIAYGFWMATGLSLYADLIADPIYLRTVVNTLLFVGIGVNVKLFLAVLLSGFFMQRRWWIRPLLLIFILPWALSAVPTFTSFHWMLIGPGSFVDSVTLTLFGIEAPIWFNNRWLALGCDIVSYIWKWMPFWTVIFRAARMAIPREVLEAAEIDGATGSRRFIHVTFPLLANIYLISTLLATVWAIGDSNAVGLVSGGAPKMTTEVLATLGLRYAFDMARPELAIAAAVSALPVLIPLTIVLMREMRLRDLQL